MGYCFEKIAGRVLASNLNLVVFAHTKIRRGRRARGIRVVLQDWFLSLLPNCAPE